MTTTATATVVRASYVGATAAGSISVPGLQVGDVVIQIVPFGFQSGMEEVISVADEIQQNANLDWSTATFTIYLIRGV